MCTVSRKKTFTFSFSVRNCLCRLPFLITGNHKKFVCVESNTHFWLKVSCKKWNTSLQGHLFFHLASLPRYSPAFIKLEKQTESNNASYPSEPSEVLLQSASLSPPTSLGSSEEIHFKNTSQVLFWSRRKMVHLLETILSSGLFQIVSSR